MRLSIITTLQGQEARRFERHCYKIATGTNRYARSWKTQELKWSELVSQLSKATVTKETASEYKRMNKSQQGDVKDVGGFVGGYIPKMADALMVP